MNDMTKIESPLSRKAVLVAVNISVWTARKLDRKITNEVNQQHNAKADAGRYNKLLIQADRLKAINEMVSAARDLHYRMTKPWGDDGQRILPNVLYNDFTNKFRVLKQNFAEAADQFCQDYPRFVQERKVELNGMFNEADYPSAKEIRSKFNLDLRFSNLPDAADFRSDVLDADTIGDIKAEIEKTARTAEREAIAHTYRQIAEVVGRMATRLAEYSAYKANPGEKKYFKDSLVENVRDLVKLVPAFNMTGDPKLFDLANRMEHDLCVENADALRENDNLREAVKKSAEEILADVQAVMA